MIVGYYLYKKHKGKGDDEQSYSNTAAGLQHHSTPLSALRDPAEFGAPPKRTPGANGSPLATSASSEDIGPAPSAEPTHPHHERSYAAQKAQEEPKEDVPPPLPHRTNTTSVSTANIPLPPRLRGNGAAQAGLDAATGQTRLPPRLPIRDSGPSVPAPIRPAYEPIQQASGVLLNQGAIDRLGKAGVTVPDLGVESRASPSLPPRTTAPVAPSPDRPATPASPQQSQLSELQERFAHMRTGSPKSVDSGSGTTWTQKRAPIEMASSIKKDLPSNPATEVRVVTSTATNFGDRHTERAGGVSALIQKFGEADRAASRPSSSDGQLSEASTSPSSPAAAAHKKKPPPPPPPRRKKELSGKGSS